MSTKVVRHSDEGCVNMELIILDVGIAAIFIVIVVFVTFKLRRADEEKEQCMAQLAEYRRFVTVRQNLLRADEGIFMLVSLDQGINWYEFFQQEDGAYVFVGKVDPSVIAQLDANADLADFVSKHGPLDPGNADQMNLLRAAGFTVTSDD